MIQLKKQTCYYSLLFYLGAVMFTACKDPYLDQQRPENLNASHMRQTLPNARPALALGAKEDHRSVSPIKCRPTPYAVCIGLFPELTIPEVYVLDFPDLPIGPDPCPWGISCPPFIPIVTEMLDATGNPIQSILRR